MGYVWLTNSDAEQIMKAGHGVIRVNPPDGPRFLDSYSRDSIGRVSVRVKSPPCPFLDSVRRCTIHTIRPLVCHLYPLSLETFSDGTIAWALHRNCNHVRILEEKGNLDTLVNQVRELLSNMSAVVRDEVLAVHRAASAVSQPISDEDAKCLLLVSKV